jgi:hypothetical protein
MDCIMLFLGEVKLAQEAEQGWRLGMVSRCTECRPRRRRRTVLDHAAVLGDQAISPVVDRSDLRQAIYRCKPNVGLASIQQWSPRIRRAFLPRLLSSPRPKQV